MASVADILRTIGGTLTTGINAAGITTPGEVIVGWPTASQGAAIWGAGQWLVSLYPQNTHKATRYRPTPGFISGIAPACPLVATVYRGTSSTTIALSGTNAAGINLHTIVGLPASPYDTLYQTTGTESLQQIAASIAVLINAIGVPGFNATANSANIVIAGNVRVWCNVAQTISASQGTYVQEVARYRREVQVTVWASIPDIYGDNSDGSRENIEAALLASIGGTDQPYQYAPDGSAFSALWSRTGDWSDKAESSYSVFRSDNYLEIEYGQLKALSETPVGVVAATSQLGTHAASTEIIGGT